MSQSPARQLGELGVALLQSGVSVTDVATSLERAADRHGLGRLDFAVLPEVILITEPYSGNTTVVQSRKLELTFSQAASVNRLARRVEAGTVSLGEVPGRVEKIRAFVRTHPTLKWILGTALLSFGIALLFRTPWWAVILSLLVGTLVGAVSKLLGRIGGAAAIMPFLVAFVSTASVGAIAHLLSLGPVPLFAVCAPIAILVPGALITNALLELTASDIVTGASRLVYGLVILSFMAAGITAGGALTGLHVDPGSVVLVGEAAQATALGPDWQELPPLWFSWIGVVFLALGIGLAFGSGRALNAVNVAVMLCAYALITLLTPALGNLLATGVTAASLFVAARLIERLTLSVPATVSFQPAFLLLVPGTVGLVALYSFNVDSLIASLMTFASLCIGTKVGDVVSEAIVQRRKETA